MTGKMAASSKFAATSKLPAAPFAAGQEALGANAGAITTNMILPMASGNVLTVGAGMEFATLSAALKASVSGETIVVKAGTYVNDFCTVNANVTVLAMGGMVHEVATVEPPNGKGIIVTNADLTIRGFSFTGGSDGSPDGNVSAIRYQSGVLNVSYCDIHDMEEGILATPLVAGTGSVRIDHSEIYNCGTGDGYSHDIYVGAVGRFVLTNSYIHNANVGHEVKSRAAETVIRNNVIADGTGGTSSYEIDVPNAGAAIITGNTIEKGPLASNNYVIHYGGETQYAWGVNSLLVSGNTIINHYGANAYAVLNQSAVNGLAVVARVVGNTLYGFSPQTVLLGQGVVLREAMLSADPGYSQAQPWTDVPTVTLQGTTERLALSTFGNVVTGGTDLLVVNDTAGNNSVAGGSGGLSLVNTAGWDLISTQANATDSITVDGRNNTVSSAGHDTIIDNGMYDQINASGPASIVGNSYAAYALSGVDAVTVGGAGTVHVLAGGQVTAAIGVNGVAGEKDAGGVLAIAGIAAHGMQATVSGGSAAFGSNNGGDFELTGQHGALTVVLGSGAAYVTGGDGNDQFTTGSGTALLTLGAGNDHVTFGSGAATVVGGSGAETYVFGAAAGSAVIEGFKQGVDALSMQGASIDSGTIANGSTLLTLSNGALVDLSGVALAAYAGSGGGGGPGNGGSGGGSTASGSVTLTAGGHSLVGGASLLSVADYAGGNTIAGGSGGLQTAPLSHDVLSTATGSSNQLALTGNDTLTGSGADQVVIGGTYDDIVENASASVTLAVYGNTVSGGAGMLTVADNFGGNTIAGGAGGLDAVISGASDVVSTLAGVADTVSASGYSTLTLAGNDAVTLTGNYNVLTATGTDVIAANGGWSTYNLEGQETVQGVGAGVITVGGQADVTLVSTGAGGSAVTKAAGGVLQFEQVMPSGAMSAITVSGGAATAGSSGGNYAGITVTTTGAGDSIVAGAGSVSVTSAGADTIWAGSGSLAVHASGALTLFGGSGQTMVTAGGAGVSIQGGSGNITLTGGTGNDSFTGGSGSSVLWLGSGADSVTFGAGGSEIHAGSADVFTAVAGMHGSDTIFGFGGSDTLQFHGFAGNAVASETMSGGNGFLTLTDGSSIELMNIGQLPHFS